MKCGWAWLLCIPFLLAGCGGGGGSTGPAPVVTITSQPTDQNVVEGQPAEFKVAATNANAYQWQLDTGSGWNDVSAATHTSLSIASATAEMDGHRYRVVVSGKEGQIVSSAATLRVSLAVVAPTIIVSPVDQSTTEGEDAVFSVTVAGTSPTYQWKFSADGTAWSDVTDAHAAQLRLTGVSLEQDGIRYRVRVSNAQGEVISSAALLHVRPIPVAPAFTAHPVNASVTAGQKATFSVVAAGTPVPSLQWQSSTDGGNTWVDIPSATSSAYTTAATQLADDGMRFRAVATNSADSVASNTAVLTVRPVPVAPSFSEQPQSHHASTGASVTFTSQASGTPTPSLQWQTSDNGTDWYNVNGATNAAYTYGPVSGADHGRLFRVVASSTAGTAHSAAATLTVDSVGSSASLSLLWGALGDDGSLDGTGSEARFSAVTGLAFDSAGNLLITDWIAQTVRKMSSSGTVSTWLGLYRHEGSVDGVGMAARFRTPKGIAVDTAGNAYVVDSGNQSVRKVSPTGVVTTLAVLTTPRAVAVDASGMVYVCDSSWISRVDRDGTVTTLAGGARGHVDGQGTAARFENPRGIAVGPDGDLYVTDSSNTVRRVTPSGDVTTIAGVAYAAGSDDGPGASAKFNSPTGIAVDSTGYVYLTESANRTIRKISPLGVVSTVAGTPGVSGLDDGNGALALFVQPEAIAVASNGDLYVGDTNRIRRISGSIVSTVAGLDAYRSGHPQGVVADSAGNFYVAMPNLGSIWKFAADGTPLTHFPGLSSPTGLAIDAADNVYIAEAEGHTVRVLAPGGALSVLAGSPGQPGSANGAGAAARFNSPAAVAVDASGQVYVADRGNHAIRRILPDGTVSTLSGQVGTSGYADGLGSAARYLSPHGVAVNTAGEVFVADENGVIRRIDNTGKAWTLAGLAQHFGSADGVGSAARFSAFPTLAMHNGVLHVADDATLRTIDGAGRVSTIAGVAWQFGVRLGTDPRFNSVSGMATLDANHLLLVSEDAVLVLTR